MKRIICTLGMLFCLCIGTVCFAEDETLQLGKKIKVNDNYSFTLEEVTSSFSMTPRTPRGSYTYYKGHKGKTYVCIVGTIENHSNKAMQLKANSAEHQLTFFSDGESVFARAYWACGENDIELKLDAGQKDTLYIFAAVNDGTLRDLKEMEVIIALPDDFDTEMEGPQNYYVDRADHFYSGTIPLP